MREWACHSPLLFLSAHLGVRGKGVGAISSGFSQRLFLPATPLRCGCMTTRCPVARSLFEYYFCVGGGNQCSQWLPLLFGLWRQQLGSPPPAARRGCMTTRCPAALRCAPAGACYLRSGSVQQKPCGSAWGCAGHAGGSRPTDRQPDRPTPSPPFCVPLKQAHSGGMIKGGATLLGACPGPPRQVQQGTQTQTGTVQLPRV